MNHSCKTYSDSREVRLCHSVPNTMLGNPSHIHGTSSFTGVPAPPLNTSHCLRVRELLFSSRVPKGTSLTLPPALQPTVQKAPCSPWSCPGRKQLQFCHRWALTSFPYLCVSSSTKLDPTKGLWGGWKEAELPSSYSGSIQEALIYLNRCYLYGLPW